MCRSDDHHFGSHRPDTNHLLSTNSFYLKLNFSESISTNNYDNPLSDSLTLLFPPRTNGSPLEVNGSKIRPDSRAYVTLHRLVNADASEAVFGTTEMIRVGEGVKFEVYIVEDKLLTGIFRRRNHYGAATRWRVECTRVLKEEIAGVSMVVAADKQRRRRMSQLEEIPEEEESPLSLSSSSSWESSDWSESGWEEDLTAVEKAELEYEMEGVRWAVDVGIWVVCLGVGYLVSKASAKTLRRRKILL